MDKSWWAYLESMLERVLALEPADRQAFLDRECGDDAALRKELEALLSADEQAQNFLEKPLLASVAEAIAADNDDLDADLARMEGYELRDRLGEGGMGIVFLARQVGRLDREVALKVMKSGLADRENRVRFGYECESLARMNHRNIARIYDSGTTPGGRPYFSMEHLEGQPITDFCREQVRDRRQVIDLFLQVCRGVHHAHQQRIIHRDLKPSNIIVVVEDDQPVAKIIDFGIAVSDREDADDGRDFIKRIIGTPSYMSPEQVDPQMGIDTRTDIFCLGTVLYELLAGEPPFATRTPEPMSPAGLQMRRQLWAAGPLRVCGDDLDWILRRVLAGDKAERYQSVTALMDDLTRYLEGRPVLARPATRRYLLTKFVGRNRLGVAIAAGLAVILAAFAVHLYLSNLRMIAKNRELSTLSESKTNVVDFLTNQFLSTPRPGSILGSRNPDTKVIDAIRESEKKIATFADDPQTEASIRQAIGQTYSEMGKYNEARPHLEKALILRRQTFGPEHPDTLADMKRLALLATREGHFRDALSLHAEVLAIAEKTGDPFNPARLLALRGRADTLLEMKEYAKAEADFREVYRRQSEKIGPHHRDALVTLRGWGMALYRSGQREQGKARLEEARQWQAKLLGDDDAPTLLTATMLANILLDDGRPQEAEQVYREILAKQETTFGSDNPLTTMNRYNLARALQKQGKYAEALPLAAETVDKRIRTLGATHSDTLNARNLLGTCYKGAGDLSQAILVLSEALKDCQATADIPKRTAWLITNNLAEALAKAGRSAEAETLLTHALAASAQGSESERSLQTTLRCTLGQVFLQDGRNDRALALFEQLVHDPSAQGDTNIPLFRSFMGTALAKLGRFEEAEAELLVAYAALEGKGQQKQVRGQLFQFYTDRGRLEEARRYGPDPAP